uniref:Uncharacterized protein n=1 Tax=Romanomermis culicivorax TaxID=13658 RepID=A0A915JSI1_ROMCU
MTDCLYGNNLSIENAGESLQSNVHDEDEEVKIDQCPSTTTNDEENNNSKSQFTPSTDSYSNPSESNQDSNLTTPNRQNVHSTNFIPPQFLMANPFVTGGHFSDSNTVNEENSAAPQNYFVTPQYYRQLLQEYMEKLTLEHERSIIDGRTGVSPASELGEIVYDDIQESIERLKLKRSCKSEEGNEQNHMENKEEEKQLDENRGIKEKPESNVEISCQFDEPIARNELNSDHMIDENSTGSKNGEKERATVAVLADDFNKKTLKQTTPVSPESRTAVLIKKQINEIEKQLMRRAQNENIKKIDPSELHEFLTDITTTNGEDNPCSDNVSNFRENFTPSQQFTAASTPQHPAAAFYNAAHFFHLLRMQQVPNNFSSRTENGFGKAGFSLLSFFSREYLMRFWPCLFANFFGCLGSSDVSAVPLFQPVPVPLQYYMYM